MKTFLVITGFTWAALSIPAFFIVIVVSAGNGGGGFFESLGFIGSTFIFPGLVIGGIGSNIRESE